MLYLQESGSGLLSEAMDTESTSGEGSKGQLVEEDEVDKVLSKEDGRIVRKKDPQLWAIASFLASNPDIAVSLPCEHIL